MRSLILQAAFPLLAGVLSLTPETQSQDGGDKQKPGYNVQVNLVSLDVEVLDGQGNPVLGLNRQDFIVKENGEPVEISHFAWQRDMPVSLAMVLDTSAISSDKLVIAKRFLVELAHRLDPTDELCLYSFDARDAYLEQDFTPRRRLLMDALDTIAVPSKASGGFLHELFGRSPPTGLAIDLALKRLEKTSHGKKALLLVSNRFRGLGPATVEHLQRSGCTLLTLEFNSSAAAVVTLGGDRISKNQLLRESGGRRFSAETENMEGECHQIAFALKNYYALGYLVQTAAEKKRLRIDVSVPGHDYTVHYRRTYAGS